VGARHSLTSLHASGLHGLLHHIHRRATATTGSMAHHATGVGEGLAIARELLAAVGERLACLLELRLWREAGLRGMCRRREAAKRGLLAVEGLVIHRTDSD
jgi:hypothetical protein